MSSEVNGSSDHSKQAEQSEPKLTLRQRLFIRHYTDPESPGFGNATRAAELAGYRLKEGSNQLAVQGHNNLRNPNVRQEIERILDEAGCTHEHAALRMREAMDAVQVRTFMKKNGEIAYSDALPDNKERRQAAEFVLRFRGSLQLQSESETESTFKNPPEIMKDQETKSERTPAAEQESDEDSGMSELIEQLRRLDAVDRSLILDAARKSVAVQELNAGGEHADTKSEVVPEGESRPSED